MDDFDSGTQGRVRGFLRVGGRAPAGGKVSACCNERTVAPDVNGAYTIEATAGWHELWFAAHGAVGESRLVEFVTGETRVEAEMDLLAWPVVNDARAGDGCPRHPQQKLTVAAPGATFKLDDFEMFARYPFPGDANWGRHLPEFVGCGELLRCEACAQAAARAVAES
jgi:hypothetical protein